MNQITITAGSEILNESMTLHADPAWHNQIHKLSTFTVYGEHYDRAVLTTLRDMSDAYKRGYTALALDKLLWCLERKFLAA